MNKSQKSIVSIVITAIMVLSLLSMKVSILFDGFPQTLEGSWETAMLAIQNIEPITEDGIVGKACDFGYRTRKRNDLKSGSQVVAGKSVICAMGDGSTLSAFFQFIVPHIAVPFTLVTLEHDDSVPHKPEWLDHQLLMAWFGWNIQLKHHKLHALPIGLNAGRHLDNILKARSLFLNRKKNGRVLVNFKLDRRERLLAWAASEKWVKFADRIPYDHKFLQAASGSHVVGLVSELGYYDLMSNYTFAMCPKGLGEDTHRLWEALYLNVRPIALRSSISSLYDNLPVVQLDQWDDLTEERLQQELSGEADFGSRDLHLQTWVERIRNTSL